MNIRKMCTTDYSGVYQLWLSCKGVGLNNLDDSEAGITSFLLKNPDTCLVAELDGRIVGVILIGNDGRRGYIYHTAVSPDHRLEGIGTRLVQQALHNLHDLGIHKVALVAFTSNQSGNEFWEKQGFTLRQDLSYRNKVLSPDLLKYTS